MNILDQARADAESDPRVRDLFDTLGVVESVPLPPDLSGRIGVWLHGFIIGLALSGDDADDLLFTLRAHPVFAESVDQAIGDGSFTDGLRRAP